jgi:ethanolamine utilization protein EutQ (cupin superfamily)
VLFKHDEGSLRKISDNKSVLNMLTLNDSNKISVGEISSLNLDAEIESEGDRAYYVLDGKLVIDNLSAEKGDIIFIPQNSRYKMKGALKAVIINSPLFGFSK